jgi:hypothetical protein
LQAYRVLFPHLGAHLFILLIGNCLLRILNF